MLLQVISASPAQAGTLFPSLVTSSRAHDHHSLQLIVHDLPPKSRVETQVKIRLDFANIPVASPGGAARWRWLRLPFTASIKQPRYFDHGMHPIMIFLCVSHHFKILLRPNHYYIYMPPRSVLVKAHLPLAARPVMRGKPNAALNTTRSPQIPILPLVFLISPANPYSTCPVVAPICRSVRAFLVHEYYQMVIVSYRADLLLPASWGKAGVFHRLHRKRQPWVCRRINKDSTYPHHGRPTANHLRSHRLFSNSFKPPRD